MVGVQCWHAHLDLVLRENGFEKVEGWPSVWARGSTLLTIVVFIAYGVMVAFCGGVDLSCLHESNDDADTDDDSGNGNGNDD